MGFLDKLFGKSKDEPKKEVQKEEMQQQVSGNYASFWKWFQDNQQEFHQIIAARDAGNIDEKFFSRLRPELDKIREGYFYLTGMLDDETVDLILTADGNISNFVFVEELVAAAPAIKGWNFQAHKPAVGSDGFGLQMNGYKFGEDNMSFYAKEYDDYPDQIDIVVVHHDYKAEDNDALVNGSYIFLDNYLGELHFAVSIDELSVIGKDQAEAELIPMSKMKDYLIWRQKEFVEKYEGVRYDTENDGYSSLEAKLKSGGILIATINTTLLNWDSKASHPWVGMMTLKYSDGNNGMPNDDEYGKLNDIEDEMMEVLKDEDGYLNVGRQTASCERDIFFACKDFRKLSKVFAETKEKHGDSFEISYDIYKDKYWQTFEKFNVSS